MIKLRPMPMHCALATFGLLLLFLLAGVIPGKLGPATAIFKSPVFIGLAVMLGVGLLWTSATRPASWRQIPFWVCHLGAVLIGGGALVSHCVGERHLLLMRTGEGGEPTTTFQSAEGMMGDPVEMPFPLSIGRFRVETYDPERYFLYQFKPGAKEGDSGNYERIATVPVRNDKTLDLSTVPGLPRELTAEPIQAGISSGNGGNRWSSRIPLGEYQLIWDRPQDKSIVAVLNVGAGVTPTAAIPFKINDPADYGGWRFYLMGYDTQRISWVTVIARRDPGRRAVLAGCWLLIAGVALMCFRRAPVPTLPEGGVQ